MTSNILGLRKALEIILNFDSDAVKSQFINSNEPDRDKIYSLITIIDVIKNLLKQQASYTDKELLAISLPSGRFEEFCKNISTLSYQPGNLKELEKIALEILTIVSQKPGKNLQRRLLAPSYLMNLLGYASRKTLGFFFLPRKCKQGVSFCTYSNRFLLFSFFFSLCKSHPY